MNNQPVQLLAIVLTLNEERHLERCLRSLEGVASKVVVVDCFSSDSTLDIARRAGACVLQRQWTNHADQFNWALAQLPHDCQWVLRLDADEYITAELGAEIRQSLPSIAPIVNGIFVNRRMTFQRQRIRFGGVFPVQVLRIFRYGKGECENRWMDEHIRVTGRTINFNAEIIDDNHNSLDWWINKHNRYASLEAIELLDIDYRFLRRTQEVSLGKGSQAGRKRWIKEKIYVRLPNGLRALLYFLYRYIVRFGFLDGQEGLAFHFLQGFWYRYLVDLKTAEVRRHIRDTNAAPEDAVRTILGVDLGVSDFGGDDLTPGS